jgi:hypothetical protein
MAASDQLAVQTGRSANGLIGSGRNHHTGAGRSPRLGCGRQGRMLSVGPPNADSVAPMLLNVSNGASGRRQRVELKVLASLASGHATVA